MTKISIVLIIPVINKVKLAIRLNTRGVSEMFVMIIMMNVNRIQVMLYMRIRNSINVLK